MERKYRALGTISGIYKIIGAVVAGGALFLGALSILSQLFLTRGASYGYYGSSVLITPIAIMISGIVTGLLIYAAGEIFQFIRDVELNTRRQAEAAEENARYARASAAYLQRLAQVSEAPNRMGTGTNLPPPPERR